MHASDTLNILEAHCISSSKCFGPNPAHDVTGAFRLTGKSTGSYLQDQGLHKVQRNVLITYDQFTQLLPSPLFGKKILDSYTLH